MLVFKQGSPEAQLLDLFELVEKSSHMYVDGAGASDLENALRVAREALAGRIRAVSAEIGKISALLPEPTFAPVDPSTLKVGDEVWVRATVSSLDLEDKMGLTVEVFSGLRHRDKVTHWPEPTSIHRRSV